MAATDVPRRLPPSIENRLIRRRSRLGSWSGAFVNRKLDATRLQHALAEHGQAETMPAEDHAVGWDQGCVGVERRPHPPLGRESAPDRDMRRRERRRSCPPPKHRRLGAGTSMRVFLATCPKERRFAEESPNCEGPRMMASGERSAVLRAGWHLPRCTAAMDESSAIFRRMVGGSGSVWQHGVSDAGTQRASVGSSRSISPPTSSRLTPDSPRASTSSPT